MFVGGAVLAVTCSKCGASLPEDYDMSICSHHPLEESEKWSINNRIMCNYLHRGKPLPRLKSSERDLDDMTTEVRGGWA